MIYMPWNEFCMIRVIWEVSDGFSREVWSSSLPSDHDLTGGGSPPPKIEKNKFVLKWFLGNFKCFKLVFSKKKKKINGKLVRCCPHPPTLTENSVNFFFFFFNPSLSVFKLMFKKFHVNSTYSPIILQSSAKAHLQLPQTRVDWSHSCSDTDKPRKLTR